MNWDAISAVSDTVSSVAVIVSLIYLAVQIRQSNKLSRGQTRIELRHMANTEVNQVIDYPEIQLAWTKEDLTAEERVRLNFFLTSALRFREFIWRQHREGLLDDATFENYSTIIVLILGPERCRRWWNNYSATGAFDPEFVRFVNGLLSNGPQAHLQGILEDL